ncbi:toxin-antitoxin system HicB family antitoxin [Roseofilum sp. BLCC_M114]|uniref:Toxin-antitoxin system HicB family antitoxin n=1 Tax=Roseofilum capinflatum BLCC-M114 TaxID=3022440 RepID=A0ABT7B3N7_9CYAN|nr:toxin-antitoxin system HicB family antitoxin [Roseofilum capinflatum]MDJ1173792.1 toxin-antitoxin system HicB family antitoxin [Roseofilum capinflatum BLCC-M114]
MSQVELQLPETLHQQLTQLAENEGVSLNQYIVYALTRQVTMAYTVQAIPTNDRHEENVLIPNWKHRLYDNSMMP